MDIFTVSVINPYGNDEAYVSIHNKNGDLVTTLRGDEALDFHCNYLEKVGEADA